MSHYLRPRHFLFGVFLGFVICCIAGYFVSTKARLSHFSRFFMEIQPQTLYYPTASELLQTIRHDVSKDKILVLIGGSSILRGVGQDPATLWSNKLQQRLGDKYKVVNYASDGASFSSYGGVVFRMLRDEYPKIIFIAASYQFNSEGNMDGLPPYDYLFWDAYYKKLFHPYKKEAELIKSIRKDEMGSSTGVEQHIMTYLDSWFYFRNLWNWAAYRGLFTVYSAYEFRKPFKHRRFFRDQEIDPVYKKILINVNKDPEHFKLFKDHIINGTASQMVDISKKPLQILPRVINTGYKGYDEVFQDIDRQKILMVQTTCNTHILNSVPKKYRDGYWYINSESHKMIKSLGYNIIDVGEDFSGDDFLDVDHLLESGGTKLAEKVSKEVVRIAKVNGYV